VRTVEKALKLVEHFYKTDMQALENFKKELQTQQWACVLEYKTGYCELGDIAVKSYIL
jgi:hypothetical protein